LETAILRNKLAASRALNGQAQTAPVFSGNRLHRGGSVQRHNGRVDSRRPGVFIELQIEAGLDDEVLTFPVLPHLKDGPRQASNNGRHEIMGLVPGAVLPLKGIGDRWFMQPFIKIGLGMTIPAMVGRELN
jgi:hypothetical protein